MYRFDQSEIKKHKELALFETPIVEVGSDHKKWYEHRAHGGLNTDGPIEFNIKGSGPQYLDLKNSVLSIKAKILNSEGENFEGALWIENTEGGKTTKSFNPNFDVAPVNLFLHSMISQIELFFQQESVSHTRLYPYKSYFETLAYPYDVHKGESELFYKDSPNSMNAYSISGGNEGLSRRLARIAGNKICDMEGELHLDIWQQDRYLINGVDILVKIWPTTSNFCTMSNIGRCTVKITDAALKICKVDLQEKVFDHHELMIKHNPALYPYLKTQMKVAEVSKDLYSFDIDDVFQNQIPCHLMFGLVETEAYNGNVQKNPYDFQNCKLKTVGVFVNGTAVPHEPYVLDFNGLVNNSSCAYRNMFIGNPDLKLSHDEFEHGSTLFKYFLYEPDLIQEGNCKIQLEFAETLKKNMTLIIMGKFPAMLSIDKDRKITKF